MTSLFIDSPAPPIKVSGTKPSWMVPACGHCARAIIKTTYGTWSHVSDFNRIETDHMPIPVLSDTLGAWCKGAWREVRS